MPGMRDERFQRTVVYICAHSDEGAMGLVINKPIDIKLKNLFEKIELKLDHRAELAEQPVYFGGPVQTERGFVLPERRAALAYSMLAPEAWSRVRTIVQRTVASGLVYLPSSAADFAHPEVAPLLSKYVRGSGGIDAQRRVKVMKLLWDAVGSEFAGRHDLYEQLYAGGWETLRLQAASEAERSGRLAAMEALADRCMDDYDLDGWTSPAWTDAC